MKLNVEMETKRVYKTKVDKDNPIYDKEGNAIGFASSREGTDVATGAWFKTFQEGLTLLRECNKPEYDLFLLLCTLIEHQTGNIIQLNIRTKVELRKELNMSAQAFDRNLRSIQKKNLIKRWSGPTFLINPEIAYLGTEASRWEAHQVYDHMEQ